MKTGFAAMGGALVLFAGFATAQTNTTRQYDSQIQMHTTPATLLVPESSLEPQKGAPESIELDLMIRNDRLQESRIPANGPRLKATREKQQNMNWLLPSSTEKKDEETISDQQKETNPSGWGWLADDVNARQQHEKRIADQERNDSDHELPSPSLLQKEVGDRRKTDGIFLNTAFKPVSASIPTKEHKKAEAGDVFTLDKKRDEQESRQDGPTTAESPLNRATADQPRGQKFGADATWGNENLWDKKSKAVGTLPQTEALLSISKPYTIKQARDFDRPGFKPDVGGRAGERAPLNRPETGRRNFETAASFQPMPAVPVHDLDTTHGAGNLPSKTPSVGSPSFIPRPSATPSPPIESLKAPELPKPVTALWLR